MPAVNAKTPTFLLPEIVPIALLPDRLSYLLLFFICFCYVFVVFFNTFNYMSDVITLDKLRPELCYQLRWPFFVKVSTAAEEEEGSHNIVNLYTNIRDRCTWFSRVQLEMTSADDLRLRMIVDPHFHQASSNYPVACMIYISRNGMHRILRWSHTDSPSLFNQVMAAKEQVGFYTTTLIKRFGTR